MHIRDRSPKPGPVRQRFVDPARGRRSALVDGEPGEDALSGPHDDELGLRVVDQRLKGRLEALAKTCSQDGTAMGYVADDLSGSARDDEAIARVPRPRWSCPAATGELDLSVPGAGAGSVVPG
jgi:hypothetical protein